MACANNKKCNARLQKEYGFPVDQNSLYNDKVYDDSSASTTCYQKKPIKIREGFSALNPQVILFIKIAIAALLLLLLFNLVSNRQNNNNNNDVIYVDMDPITSLSYGAKIRSW